MNKLKIPFLALGLVVSAPTQAISPSELFKNVSPSVVVVKVYDKRDKLLAFGSGVTIANGVVATNCHVLFGSEHASYSEIEYLGKNLGADLREVDRTRDLCTLNVTALSSPPATIGASTDVEVGSRVYAIGAPEGYKLSLSDGLVSGKREIEGNQLIQVTAPISHGSSGGGLFDSSGRLVGITTLTDASGQALNFAIPAEWIAELPRRSSFQPNKQEPADQHSSEPENRSSDLSLIFEDPSRRIYLDRSTLKRTGNTVNVTALTRYSRPQPAFPEDPGNRSTYKYEIEDLVFVCNRNQFNSYRRITYDDDFETPINHELSGSSLGGDVYFFDISVNVKRGLREIQIEAACSMN